MHEGETLYCPERGHSREGPSQDWAGGGGWGLPVLFLQVISGSKFRGQNPHVDASRPRATVGRVRLPGGGGNLCQPSGADPGGVSWGVG